MTNENASVAPERPELDALMTHFSEISALDVDSDLVRSGELGGMNFGEWREELVTSRNLVSLRTILRIS